MQLIKIGRVLGRGGLHADTLAGQVFRWFYVGNPRGSCHHFLQGLHQYHVVVQEAVPKARAEHGRCPWSHHCRCWLHLPKFKGSHPESHCAQEDDFDLIRTKLANFAIETA